METLEIAERLESVGIPNRDAYKIAETINGKSGLAAKEDIHLLKEDVSHLKSELKDDIHNLDKKIDLINTNLDKKIEVLKWMIGVIIACVAYPILKDSNILS